MARIQVFPSSRKRLFGLFSLLVIIGIISGFLAWFGSAPGFFKLSGGIEKEPQEAKRGVPVKTLKIERKDLVTSLTAMAALESERSVEVVAKIEGVITRILAEEGDRVQEGAPLCLLDEEPLKLSLRKAKLSMESSYAELKRAEGLNERNLITTKDYESARLKHDIAVTEFDEARLRLSYATVTAPFSGVIVNRSIEVGQSVKTGEGLFTIMDKDPLIAHVFLPEQDMYGLEAGQEVRLSAASQNGHGPPRSFSGRIDRLSPVVDPATGTVKVRISAYDPPEGVRPGSFVRIAFDLSHSTDVLSVPKAALVREGSRVFLFVARGSRAKKVPVKLGMENEVLIEVREGVEEGDNIVIRGKEGLKDGTLIKSVDESSDLDV